MRDLSVIIPARQEVFLSLTVENILKNIRANTEVIAVCDGSWPDPPVKDHPRVNVIHFTESVGQRAATNAGSRLSRAKYVMKCDAHCAFDEGFDAKLIEDCQPDWVMVPSMWNLHAFDWKCKGCGHRSYQGWKPQRCSECKSEDTDFEQVIVWEPRKRRQTVSWRFDTNLQFQYWKQHSKRPEVQGDLIETMSFIGACMFMERDYFWYLGGCDESHGSWGQYGTEWACKTWLSGGKLVTSRKTWFAHMFRTGNFRGPNGESTWPYPISGRQIVHARSYSQDYWKNNRWPKQIHPLSWLVEKFWPVKGWEDSDLAAIKTAERTTA